MNKTAEPMFEYKKVSMLDMPRVDMELLETRAGNAVMAATASAILLQAPISS